MIKKTLLQATEIDFIVKESLARRSSPESEPTSEDMRQVIHEMQAHQFDLERQVAELRQARVAAESSLQRLTDLYDLAPIGFMMLNRGGEITYANKTGARILGVERGALAGRRLMHYVAMSHQNELRSFLARVFAAPSNHACEVELMRQRGQAAALQQSQYRQEQGNSVAQFVAIEGAMAADGQECRLALIDITERKHAEDRYRTVVEWSPSAIVVHWGGKIIYVNGAAIKLFGATSPQNLVGMPFLDRIHPDFHRAVMARVKFGIDRNAGVPMVEMKYIRLDGESIDAEIQSVMIEYAGVPAIQSTLRDITDRKQAEAVVRESMRKLEEANELKSRFVSIASHEFRTPLVTIMFTADALRGNRHTMDSDKIDAYLIDISNEAEHMQSMIDDVLRLARMQSTGQETKPSLVDLDAMCRASVAQFQMNTQLQHVLDYRCAQQPVKAMLDVKLMKEVINNLISNALKYSAAGTTVSISLARSDAALTLTVSDQGIGIPAHDIPRLFEPFQRASNVNEIQGTGLGLSIVKHAVTLHGGAIAVASEIGKGTRFIVTLPLNAPPPVSV